MSRKKNVVHQIEHPEEITEKFEEKLDQINREPHKKKD
jgi:hypothetical protein